MYYIHPFQKIKLPWLGKTGLLWVQDYQSLHSRVPNTTVWTPTGPSSSLSINSSAFTTEADFVIFREVFFVALHKRSNKVSITFSFTLTSSWFYALLGVLTFILLELAPSFCALSGIVIWHVRRTAETLRTMKCTPFPTFFLHQHNHLTSSATSCVLFTARFAASTSPSQKKLCGIPRIIM